MTLKIKPEYSKLIIAFGGTGRIELGSRPQDQLRKLAILSYSDPSIKLFFDGDIPPLADLQREGFNNAVKGMPRKNRNSENK